MAIPTERLGFDPDALPRGPGHSGRDRRVIAACRRCDIKYEIGAGGNRECPECHQLDRADVLWRESPADTWVRNSDFHCGVSNCTNEVTWRIYSIYRIPGTPDVDTYLCDEHKGLFVTERLPEDDEP